MINKEINLKFWKESDHHQMAPLYNLDLAILSTKQNHKSHESYCMFIQRLLVSL